MPVDATWIRPKRTLHRKDQPAPRTNLLNQPLGANEIGIAWHSKINFSHGDGDYFTSGENDE
jgi:hypothetical protein